MKLRIIKEIPFWVLIIVPIVYLKLNWGAIPDKIPTHYNIYGEADSWGSKNALLIITIVIPVVVYLLMLVVPYIDPKKKLQKMGNKYYSLRFAILFSMVLLAFFMSYSLVDGTGNFSDYLNVVLGSIFLLLGNYLRNLKPNYFIGIRTPWTLENEKVWILTHRYSSILWFVGGALMIVVNLLTKLEKVWLVNVSIIIVLAVVPIAYSYIEYRKLNSKPTDQ